MGYSFAYILFIGVAEILGACLLLGEKTKSLGVAILLPVMVNILVFDLIFLDKYGALASAAIYTTLLFVILALNGEKVKQSFQALVRRAHSEPELAGENENRFRGAGSQWARFLYLTMPGEVLRLRQRVAFLAGFRALNQPLLAVTLR